MQIKKIIALILLIPLYFNLVAQQKPAQMKEIIISKDAQIVKLDGKFGSIDFDSTAFMNDLSNRLCVFLENGNASKKVDYNNFVSEAFHFLTSIEEDSMSFLEEKICPGCIPESAESYTAALGYILKKNIQECPAINAIIKFDGKQRPAYAHLSAQVCKCIDKKVAGFKDRNLALLKFPYINDSCSVEVFTDEKNRDIVFKANNFETKEQVDSFDANFRPYVFKNCDIFFEATMESFSIWIKKVLKATSNTDLTPRSSINDQRNDKIQPVMYHVTGILGYPNSQSIESNFLSNSYYKASTANLNAAKLFFKNIRNLDYTQDFVLRSDDITEIKLTVYQYLAKTQKRVIKGMIIFEFEKQNDRITSFRFIPQNQIPNYDALQKKINEH